VRLVVAGVELDRPLVQVECAPQFAAPVALEQVAGFLFFGVVSIDAKLTEWQPKWQRILSPSVRPLMRGREAALQAPAVYRLGSPSFDAAVPAEADA
jgi:hypothetical protein